MKIILSTFSVLMLILQVNCDVELRNYTASICREGTVNITWKPPSGDLKYDFIDLYYTRKPEDGRTYPKITVISWTPDRWQVTWNPKRFQGRLRAQSNSPTTSFVLENVVHIDNGEYELSAVTKSMGRLYGVFTLIVYHEENYFPKLANADNSTGDNENSYTYTWQKSPESPAIGIIMKPQAGDKVLSANSCSFDSQDTCVVVFTQEYLTDGRINFEVEYLFNESSSKCHTLDEPPTNLVIVIPYAGFAQVYIAVIIICCLVVILVCVLVPLILRQREKNKYKLSLCESLDFVTRCIDHIQNYEEPADLKGVYRKTAQQKVVNALIEEYKNKKGNDDEINEFLSNVSKPDLASCVKHVLRTADQEWLPKEFQVKISEGELDANAFNAAVVRDYFRGSGKGNSQIKRDLVAAVFRHFDWFLKSTDQQDRGSVHLVDRKGLAVCVSPGLFQMIKHPDISMPERWQNFVENIIIHTDQVFPIEDDAANTADHTDAALIQKA